MLEQAVSVDDAARLAGMNRGTLWAWRGRGRLPVSDFDLADVMSLTVAARLTEFGMEVQPAASIAWGVREVWPAVVEIEESLYLLVKADPGGPTPFPFNVVTAEQLVEQYEPAALIVNLSTVAREVLAKALEASRG